MLAARQVPVSLLVGLQDALLVQLRQTDLAEVVLSLSQLCSLLLLVLLHVHQSCDLALGKSGHT